MDNFQYSVQLSDREWAEFSATADECGLLQAGLASGDELLSSDLGSDLGSDSGSSPPRPPPLFTGQLALQGRGQQGCELEDVVTQQLVSRSQCEPVLALEASHQVASTSTQSEALPFLGSDSVCPGQALSFPGSATLRDKMQRLLQGPAPSSPGEPSHNPEPGHSAMPQSAPDNLETPPRNPGRKKKRAVGTKGGKCSGSLGSAAVQMSSPQLMETRPKEVLVSGTLMVEDQQDKTQSDSAGASEHGSSIPGQMARQESGLDLSIPVIITEEDTDKIRKTRRAVPHMISKPVQEAHPDFSMATPNVSLSMHASKPQPYMALSKPASKPQSDTDLSTHVSTSDMTLSTLAFKCQPNTNQPTPASMSQWDKADCTPGLQEDLSSAGSEIKPEVYPSMPAPVVMLCTDLPHSVSKTDSEERVSIPAMPSLSPTSQAEAAMVDTDVTVPSRGYFEKPVGQLSTGSSGYSSGEPCPGPVQTPKKKKVRFSMAVPSHEESGSGEPTGQPFLTPDWPPAPKTASVSRGGSAAWDAIAVGHRLPQPRILKHLPPPTSSVSAEPEPGSCYAVTLPEAYEFFFCDTIEEEDEDVEDEAAASQALDEVQWPDTCEFFFRDSRVQRSSSQRGHSLVLHSRAEAVAPDSPGDLVPISIPEVYEHFFTEEGFGNRQPPATHIQLQTSELFREVGSEAYSKPVPATAEHLSLAIRETGELRSPLTSFTFSQNDMCLVFVAFATWAVRTSDLHAPDAWKTVLLANIGTISAIRYFRRQIGRGHNGRPRPSSDSSPSC
ncbi:PGC-1 and ERR-induced regulator in muscle protein 1 [Phodopus roborovskii]|uniref:Perm1 protein n=1 Tax=Phodopus roborovskii TaxID=109678 RepID=A0AAV0ABE0_PHORO|nr:PGC-1 and ERR-induced regulator in muscle protein 1 [Phodopus roborovskii]CAH7450116.1 Perm1 [Phodopus roborovskii]